MRSAWVAAALLLSCRAAGAGDLKSCAGIADNVMRLACYDRAAALAAEVPVPPWPAAVAVPAATPARDDAAPAPKPAEFGAEALPQAEAETQQSGTLHARMVGQFTSWKTGTLFELDNGQVWKSLDAGDRVDHEPVQAPQVTIEKGLVNYWMKVEGLHRGLKVRRVR